MKALSVILVLSLWGYVFCDEGEDPWTPDPLCPFPSDHTTRTPYPGNCSKYWECYNGARYPMDCPAGLEFNYPLQQCDAPEIANCNPDDPVITTTRDPHNTPTEGPTQEPPGTHDPLCPYPSDDIVYFPYPGDCTKYYECWQGNKYAYTCPDGLWWNEEQSYCDYPENTQCEDGPTRPTEAPTEGPTAPPDDDVVCPYPSNEVTFKRYPGDCTKFYECFEGEKTLMECPDGLWWHQSILTCDFPVGKCEDFE